MKKAFYVGAVLLLIASSGWAISDGPGGRIYLTRYSYTVNPANQVELIRVDVDAQWNVIQDFGAIAAVTNNYSLDTSNYTKPLTPAVLHPRANADGSPTGGDGSVFLASYYDSGDHTYFWKIMPDGTVSTIHPGVGNSGSAWPRTQPCTPEADPFVVDHTGQASGRAGSIMGFGGYESRTWHDVNQNDSLQDDCDTFYYPSYNAGRSGDAEIGATPGRGAVVKDSHWSMVYSGIQYVRYTGNAADCHTWATAVLYHRYSDWTLGSGLYCYWQNGTFAVGDTNGDNIVDVYVLTGLRSGYDNVVPAIWRLSDLDESGRIDCATVDYCKLIYDANTLPDAWDNPGVGDLDLIRDPATGKWFLLMMYEGGENVDGRLVVFELADNGVAIVSAKQISVVMETGGTTTSGTRWGFRAMDFDADVIPEPGTVLLLGTGLMGLLGYLRRRRMT